MPCSGRSRAANRRREPDSAFLQSTIRGRQPSYRIMGSLLQDLRFAVRGLCKSKAFTIVSVLSLGLGIGANTAVFTLLDQVLLRRLPVKQPEELTLLSMKGSHYGSNWGSNALSYPMYEDISKNNQVFSGMFCRFPTAASLTFGEKTERVA